MALNLGQREDLSKFYWDLARLIFAGLVLGPLANADWGAVWLLGGAASIMLLCVAGALHMRR